MKTPKIELLALSNFAHYSKNGSLSIVEILDQFEAESLPASYPRCYLSFIVSASPDSQIVIKIAIFPPDNSMSLQKDVVLKTGENGKDNFILELVNFNLPMQGEYKIKLFFNDIEIGQTSFFVTQTTSKPKLKKAKGKLIN